MLTVSGGLAKQTRERCWGGNRVPDPLEHGLFGTHELSYSGKAMLEVCLGLLKAEDALRRIQKKSSFTLKRRRAGLLS
ncbi:MAG: hypothetical protein D6820_13840 [Lentisphaerae bacterium]|nr:MAG: hypothetical protein D6820_13840 [Lentisphaerota bacterium]